MCIPYSGVNANDIAHLAIDFQLQKRHRVVKMNMVEVVRE